MPSNEGHIHFTYLTSLVTQVSYADQDLEITPGGPGDPEGSVYLRAVGSQETGLHIPTMGWEPVPGTSPTLEGRADGTDPVGYVRLRVA